MTFTPAHVITYPWLVVGVLWVVTALKAKRSLRYENVARRFSHMACMVAAYGLLFRRDLRIGQLGLAIVPASGTADYVGFILTVLGLAFAIWARLELGGNWSAMVTVKEQHTLVRRGPYAIVRHPIYAGGLLAMLGTAIVYGQAGCFLAVLLAFIGWWFKARREEQFMTQEFGDQYRTYQQQVKQLIPFVL